MNYISFYNARLIPPLKDNISPWYYINTNSDIFSAKTYKIMQPQLTENGYLQVHLATKNGYVCRKLHRLCMMTFNYFEGCEKYQINHKDGNKLHNWLGNLEWVTPKENIAHAIENNLRLPMYGENNLNAKITEDMAKIIIDMLLSGYNDNEISISLNIPITIIQEIAKGNTWRYLTEPYIDQLKRTRRGNKLTDEEYHLICKFYEVNKNNYFGYGAVKCIVTDALSSINIPINNTYFRIAKRLYYKYDKPEITSLYNY